MTEDLAFIKANLPLNDKKKRAFRRDNPSGNSLVLASNVSDNLERKIAAKMEGIPLYLRRGLKAFYQIDFDLFGYDWNYHF